VESDWTFAGKTIFDGLMSDCVLRGDEHGLLQGLKRFAGGVEKAFDFFAQIGIGAAVGFEKCGPGFGRQIQSLVEQGFESSPSLWGRGRHNAIFTCRVLSFLAIGCKDIRGEIRAEMDRAKRTASISRSHGDWESGSPSRSLRSKIITQITRRRAQLLRSLLARNGGILLQLNSTGMRI
jgi:hypothetical protein